MAEESPADSMFGFSTCLNQNGSEFHALALPSRPCLTSQLFHDFRGGGDHITKKVGQLSVFHDVGMEGSVTENLEEVRIQMVLTPLDSTDYFHGLHRILF